MHGEVHDWVTLVTVKDGYSKQTGGTHTLQQIRDNTPFTIPELTEQRKYKKILDIGSLDLIGSMRYFNYMGTDAFWPELVQDSVDYTGIDLMGGKNVDIVMDAHDLKFADGTFDLVMCLQMLEHDSDPARTITEAYRVLEDGGLFVLTCADEDHPEHADLGGGSTAYIKISRSMMDGYLASAGFIVQHFVKHLGNFYITATKSATAKTEAPVAAKESHAPENRSAVHRSKRPRKN